MRASEDEQATAVRAAAVLGLGVAGVDLIRSRRGPLVLEVNSSPGLEGIEAATGVDIAGRIIDHVVDGPNPARSSSRNNIGDVWVVASFQAPGKNARTLKARALLIVTVPLYVKFQPWQSQP
mgnify:CR=1 FL=1